MGSYLTLSLSLYSTLQRRNQGHLALYAALPNNKQWGCHLVAFHILVSGLLACVSAISIDGIWRNDSGMPPVRTLVVLVDDVCKCLAESGHVTNVPLDPALIAGCTASTAPYFYVTTTSISNGPCIRDGQSCLDVTNSKCSVTVKAKLIFPESSCLTSVSVTGPGIGTGDAPCQRATEDTDTAAVWTITAKCRAGESDERPAVQPITIYAAPCTDRNTAPVGGATATFLPRVKCAKCATFSEQG